MSTLSEFPLDVQFSHAVSLLNHTANAWPSLEQLANLSTFRVKAGSAQFTDAKADGSPAQKALSALSEVSENASLVSIISANEDLDEIGTSHLKYLLLPFLIASAHADWQGEHDVRLQHLSAASEQLTAFFTAMDRLRLLPLHDRDRVLGDASEQQVEPSVETREEKIQRFKAEKEAQRRLSILLERMRSRHIVLSAGGGDGEKRNAVYDADAVDSEEIIREATLVLLQSAVHRALDLRGSLLREIPLLQWAQRQRSRGVDPRERAERARPRGPPPSVVPGMPPSFRIVSERERERANVFRPSHSLPTYSVEEWGRIEAERLAQSEQEKQQKDVVAKRAAGEGDSSDDDDDHAIKEKRRWDDWKDDHNRGSGNTIR